MLQCFFCFRLATDRKCKNCDQLQLDFRTRFSQEVLSHFPSMAQMKFTSALEEIDSTKKSLPIVAAHLRGMWPAPSTDKDILTPNEKLNTPNTTNQTHN